MKQGTIRTLGVAAVGAAMAVGTAGTATAAPTAETESADKVVGQTIAQLAANTQNMSVEDAVLDLPGNITQGANATQAALDIAQAEAEASEEPQAGESRAVEPQAQQDQLGAASKLLGGLPVVGDITSGGLSTDGIQGDLLNDGLPTGSLPVGDVGALL